MSVPAPLEGVLVVDLSRMLPGAVLARGLLDLGARLIKVEDRRTGGDPMRHMPPLRAGVGLGFSHFLAGAESVAIDLRSDGELVRAMASRADVLVESFRPSTRTRVGLDAEALRAKNPALVVCRLPAYEGPGVGHDLNFVAETGLLHALGTTMPNAQIADVSTGELARTAILAALLQRHRTGEGQLIEQPLHYGPLPYLQWAYADATAGRDRAADSLIGGEVAAYRTYEAADGRIAVGCLEPKFWVAFCERFDLTEFAGRGLEVGARDVVEAVAQRLSALDVSHIVELCRAHAIPVTAVRDPFDAHATGELSDPDEPGRPAAVIPSLGRASGRAVAALGAHDQAVRAEFGT